MNPTLVRDLKLDDPFMVGDDVFAIRRACKKYLREDLSTMPKKALERRTFGPGMHDLVVRAQDDAVLPKTGVANNILLKRLRLQVGAVDDYSDFLLTKYAAEHPLHDVPQLGPIYKGGYSILLHDLTHNTDGVPGYPAFDDGWKAGRAVVAPERLQVTQQSGSQGGDAFYARGDSKIEYWIGHVVAAPATGKKFAKGATLSTIANIPYGDGGPHVHVGINAKPLIGHGLLYGATGHGPDYTHCPQTVGEQLRKWAAG